MGTRKSWSLSRQSKRAARCGRGVPRAPRRKTCRKTASGRGWSERSGRPWRPQGHAEGFFERGAREQVQLGQPDECLDAMAGVAGVGGEKPGHIARLRDQGRWTQQHAGWSISVGALPDTAAKVLGDVAPQRPEFGRRGGEGASLPRMGDAAGEIASRPAGSRGSWSRARCRSGPDIFSPDRTGRLVPNIRVRRLGLDHAARRHWPASGSRAARRSQLIEVNNRPMSGMPAPVLATWTTQRTLGLSLWPTSFSRLPSAPYPEVSGTDPAARFALSSER